MGKKITRIYDKNKVMSRKKYLLLIIAILVLEVAVYLGAFSKAEVIKSIEYVEFDTQEAYTESIEVNTDETGAYIVLPSKVNEKTVSKYYINETEYTPNTNYYITEAQESISVKVKYAEPEVTPTPVTNVTPSASPSATPSPDTSATPSASPNVSTSPDASTSPSASPNATASPNASASPSASPNASASPDASASPSASPNASASPDATTTVSPQPTDTTEEVQLMSIEDATTVYVDNTPGEGPGGTISNPYTSLAVAINNVTDGGTIVVKNIITVSEWPTTNKTITIKGYTTSSIIEMVGDWNLSGKTTIQEIAIKGSYSIYANGYELLLGTGITMIESSSPDVYGGSNTNAITGNTNVIINSGTYNNVYGGSKSQDIKGQTGTSSAYKNVFDNINLNISGSTNVTINGGTFNGNVYGGSKIGDITNNRYLLITYNENGAKELNCDIAGSANVTINSGTFNGNIYGGSKTGDITGNATLTINRKVNAQITGGTRVKIIGGTFNCNIYGGSVSGTFTGNTSFTKNTVSSLYVKGASINITGGTFKGNIYGGSTSETAQTGLTTRTDLYVSGTSVTITGGIFGDNDATKNEIYGGSDKILNGNISANTNLTISGGEFNNYNIYGGSRTVSNTASIISEIRGATFTSCNIYGGNSKSGTLQYAPSLTIEGCNFDNVYAGSVDGSITAGATSLTITGGTIGNIYANNKVGPNGSNITINNCTSNIYTLNNTNLSLENSNIIIQNSDDEIILKKVILKGASTLTFNNGVEKVARILGTLDCDANSMLIFPDRYGFSIGGKINSSIVNVKIVEDDNSYHDIEINTSEKYSSGIIKLNSEKNISYLLHTTETDIDYWKFYNGNITENSATDCIYVSSNGNDEDDGSVLKPVKTIKAAYEKINNSTETQKKIVLMSAIGLESNITDNQENIEITPIPIITSKDNNNIEFYGYIVLNENDTKIYHNMQFDENIKIYNPSATIRNIHINGNDVIIGPNVNTQGAIDIYADGTPLEIQGGTWNSVYGGSNSQSITGETNLTISGGTFTNVYGGSNSGTITGTTNVTIINDTYSIKNIYGGSNSGQIIGTTNVTIKISNKTLKKVYGGSNTGKIGIAENPGITNLVIEKGDFTGFAYGGSYSGTITGTTNFKIYDGKFYYEDNGTDTRIFGGNQNGNITGTANFVIEGGTFGVRVFGGGRDASVIGDTNVKISGNPTFNNSLYGACMARKINRNSKS